MLHCAVTGTTKYQRMWEQNQYHNHETVCVCRGERVGDVGKNVVSQRKLVSPLKLKCQHVYSPPWPLYISYTTSWEILSKNQGNI